jgi:hypothetical protein
MRRNNKCCNRLENTFEFIKRTRTKSISSFADRSGIVQLTNLNKNWQEMTKVQFNLVENK